MVSRSAASTRILGAKLKPDTRRPGSDTITPRTVKWPVPMRISSPTRDSSCARSSGLTSAPWPFRSACEYRRPPSSSTVPYSGNAGWTPRTSASFVTARRSSAGRTIVLVSTPSARASTWTAASRRSMVARTFSSQGRLVDSVTSAATMLRASRAIATRTFCTTERSRTMPPTPTAMQRKKRISRRHDARISRTAIRMTNRISAVPVARPGAPRVRAPSPPGPRRASP